MRYCALSVGLYMGVVPMVWVPRGCGMGSSWVWYRADVALYGRGPMVWVPCRRGTVRTWYRRVSNGANGSWYPWYGYRVGVVSCGRGTVGVSNGANSVLTLGCLRGFPRVWVSAPKFFCRESMREILRNYRNYENKIRKTLTTTDYEDILRVLPLNGRVIVVVYK